VQPEAGAGYRAAILLEAEQAAIAASAAAIAVGQATAGRADGMVAAYACVSVQLNRLGSPMCKYFVVEARLFCNCMR